MEAVSLVPFSATLLDVSVSSCAAAINIRSDAVWVLMNLYGDFGLPQEKFLLCVFCYSEQ